MKKTFSIFSSVVLLFLTSYSVSLAEDPQSEANEADAVTEPTEIHTALVSNSLQGPWEDNGSVDISKMVFVRFTDIDNSKFGYPKRCLKFQGTTKCSKDSDFTSFQWGEWVNASTTRIALKRGKLLEGNYEVYVLYKDGEPEKVGAFSTWTSAPSPATVSVSNSLSGPWEMNGSVYNTGKIYTNITGLKKSKHPKVCIIGAGSTKCLTETELYRSFHEEEWIDATTTQMILNGGDLSLGTKDIYVRYLIRKSPRMKVGSMTLKAAPATAEAEVEGAATQCIDLPYNMHRGNEFSFVRTLQTFLQSQGLLPEVTGFYGDLTVAAVKAYQESRGISPTGMVYELTRGALRGETCR